MVHIWPAQTNNCCMSHSSSRSNSEQAAIWPAIFWKLPLIGLVFCHHESHQGPFCIHIMFPVNYSLTRDPLANLMHVSSSMFYLTRDPFAELKKCCGLYSVHPAAESIRWNGRAASNTIITFDCGPSDLVAGDNLVFNAILPISTS